MVEQQTTMKVYELAKELGVDSISLLDKLTSLNIKVKNHMSELQPEDVRTVRTALTKKQHGAGALSAKKAPAARVRKKTGEAAAAAPAAKEAVVEKKSASPIIRRRIKADGQTEIATNRPLGPTDNLVEQPHPDDAEAEAEEQAQQAAYAAEVEAQELAIAAQEAADTAAAEEQAAAAQVVAATPAPGIEAPVAAASAAATAVTPASAAPAAAKTPNAAALAAAAALSQAAAPLPGAGATAAGPATPAKLERKPVVLTPRPVAVRKSILRVVEPTTPARPNVVKAAPVSVIQPKSAPRGPVVGDKEGFRIIKMTKENLDQMVEEEAAKKRGGGREAEIRPEDVRFADYRKKEMVFLPKRKRLPVGKELKKTQLTTKGASKRVVEMQDTIAVHDLANQLGVKGVDVVRKLMGMGQMATINQSIDFDTATLLATEYQYEVRNVAFKEATMLEAVVEDKAEDLVARPPVVTIMGHVDHGKTSLLDAIRETKVAAGEAGGITQHIGAYTVDMHGKLITFIDTPGHEAFTVMRARGANVTDIVILVVAADDGVMPQTREALSHAQAANVPIIVAMNKMDKPGANPEKIKQQLSELNLLAEDWGGQTMFVPVSAIKKTNLDKLLESILLQSEILDLKSNPNVRANGTVLEARLERGRGPVISVLVRRGTLRVGDAVVSGKFAGKIKAMNDYLGRSVKEVGPGIAAEILGFEGVPNAGERFDAPATEADARIIAQNRDDQLRSKSASPAPGKVSLDDLFAKISAGTMKELNVVLKGDVYGSVEAIRDSLEKVSTDKVKVKTIFSAPGGITESDVMLASASNAIVIGFNVRPETKARQLADAENVEVKCYTIIYELIDDVKKSMAGLLDKKKVERFLGRAEVRQTFTVPKIGTIAGSSVIDGKLIRGANVRLLRDSRIIFEGKMSSLKRFKDDAKEVATGFECGIGLENYNDLKPGDVIEAYQIDMIAPELNS